MLTSSTIRRFQGQEHVLIDHIPSLLMQSQQVEPPAQRPPSVSVALPDPAGPIQLYLDATWTLMPLERAKLLDTLADMMDSAKVPPNRGILALTLHAAAATELVATQSQVVEFADALAVTLCTRVLPSSTCSLQALQIVFESSSDVFFDLSPSYAEVVLHALTVPKLSFRCFSSLFPSVLAAIQRCSQEVLAGVRREVPKSNVRQLWITLNQPSASAANVIAKCIDPLASLIRLCPQLELIDVNSPIMLSAAVMSALSTLHGLLSVSVSDLLLLKDDDRLELLLRQCPDLRHIFIQFRDLRPRNVCTCAQLLIEFRLSLECTSVSSTHVVISASPLMSCPALVNFFTAAASMRQLTSCTLQRHLFGSGQDTHHFCHRLAVR